MLVDAVVVVSYLLAVVDSNEEPAASEPLVKSAALAHSPVPPEGEYCPAVLNVIDLPLTAVGAAGTAFKLNATVSVSVWSVNSGLPLPLKFNVYEATG